MLDELINSIYIPNDIDTDDFVIFQKPVLGITDHYRFWLRVLEDHMIFIIERSKVYSDEAIYFLSQIVALKDFLINGGNVDFAIYNLQVIQVVDKIHKFKREILNDLVNNVIQILLPPTFISHMLNELEKFRYILYYIKLYKELPVNNSLNEHELWLSDIAGHLEGIHDNIDGVDKILRKTLRKQQHIFSALHHKALEFIGYFKHNVVDSNYFNKLNVEAKEATLLYLNLVKEIVIEQDKNLILGIINRRMLIHMIFEEIYYLKNLDISNPNYDTLASYQLISNPQSLNIIASFDTK